jgi:hypothetical protein
MGPHRKLEIYVGYKSPSIIKYLEPTIGDLFMAWSLIVSSMKIISRHLGETANTTKNARKSIGMPQTSPTLIHVLHRLNSKFKKSSICNTLQIIH